MPLGMATAGSSTIPAVLDALVAAARAALPDTQVTDGQPVGDIADDIVAIGTTGRPGEVAVQVTRDPARLATAPDGESYDIACIASCWRGAEADFKPVRDGAFALVNAVALELARDQTLGGLAMRARLSVASVFQDQVGAEEDEGASGAGAVATIGFTVHVDAFTGGP